MTAYGDEIYRFGFNGMEKDDEEGTRYTTLFRMNDVRIGRWWSVDPAATSLPWQSPYCSMDNNPIRFNDPLGDKVDPGSQQEVDNMKSATNTKITDLTAQKNAIPKSSTDASGAAAYSVAEQAQVDDLTSRISELGTVLSDIQQIENDPVNTFKLNAVSPQNFVDIAPTAQDVQTNTFTLNYEQGNMGNQIHEVAKHGAQISRGEYIFSVVNGNVNISMKAGFTHYATELAAYKGQYGYSGPNTIKGHKVPTAGSTEANLNLLGGLTGAQRLNEPFVIQNYKSLNLSLIKNMTEGAMGTKSAY